MAPALTTMAPSLLRRLALLDYPLPLKLHAYLLLGLGVPLTFVPQLVVGNPLFSAQSRLLGLPEEIPSSASTNSKAFDDKSPSASGRLLPAQKRGLSVAGLLAFGLGLSYVGTSAFVDDPKQNQLMYAAIPLRLVMSAMALLSWVTDKEARSVFKATVVVEDLVGALWLAYEMRDWPLWAGFRW